jgi:hypothetical protein
MLNAVPRIMKTQTRYTARTDEKVYSFLGGWIAEWRDYVMQWHYLGTYGTRTAAFQALRGEDKDEMVGYY